MEGESSSSTSDTPSESEHLLSFVTDQDGGMVSIHTDLAGIKPVSYTHLTLPTKA